MTGGYAGKFLGFNFFIDHPIQFFFESRRLALINFLAAVAFKKRANEFVAAGAVFDIFIFPGLTF